MRSIYFYRTILCNIKLYNIIINNVVEWFIKTIQNISTLYTVLECNVLRHIYLNRF